MARLRPDRASEDLRVPFPGVAFAGDYVRRLERLTVRLASARERREGRGSAALAGAGEEFVGYRPYRPGEDLRDLAWDLLARLDRPYVRVTRRESAERWAILLDTSGSMGVGPPGKLQVAAEVAGALACIGLRSGASVELRASDGAPPLVARRPTDLGAALGFLAERRAGGAAGLEALLGSARPAAECGRVVLIGDLLDLAPHRVTGLRGPGRELYCLQVLAPLELAPPRDTAVEWLDPEGEGRASRQLDAAALEAYERALEARLGAWDELAARHGFTHRVHPSARPFEDAVRALLEP